MKQSLNEQVARIKTMMNLHEDDAQALLQQDTIDFNEKVGEDLTPEEYKEVICSDAEELELPNLEQEQKQVVEQIKEKMKTASFAELIELKMKLKELKKQQQNEQVAAPAAITLLGISVNPGVAIAIGFVLFVLVLSFLGRLFRTKRTTYYCDGTRSRGLFGLLRW